MSRLALVRCETYERRAVEGALRRAVDLMGGISRFVKSGDRVLIKPNLLVSRARDKRVTTDPEVVRAAVLLVLEAGGRALVGDSPALGSANRVAGKSGIAEALKGLDAELIELDRPTAVSPPEGSLFRQLEIARPVLEADAVINLPKLKSHCQMLMTLGVKNLFGTVVAQRKAEWHHMAGVDRDTFASLLLDIYRTVKPALTVLDGVWGMEGRGPSNGRPRQFNLIAAAVDAVALDVGLCHLLGLPLRSFPLYRVARNRGIGVTEVKDIRFVGDAPETFAVSDFDAPRLDSVNVIPGMFDWFTRRYLVSRPVHRREACVGCGQCREICPAEAVRQEGSRIAFDYDLCIRCYCCQEICPEDAIGFRKGMIVRFLSFFNR